MTDWLHEGSVRQFLFADNDGILWEINWTPADAGTVYVGWTLDDPDPVPAARQNWAGRERAQ